MRTCTRSLTHNSTAFLSDRFLPLLLPSSSSLSLSLPLDRGMQRGTSSSSSFSSSSSLSISLIGLERSVVLVCICAVTAGQSDEPYLTSFLIRPLCESRHSEGDCYRALLLFLPFLLIFVYFCRVVSCRVHFFVVSCRVRVCFGFVSRVSSCCVEQGTTISVYSGLLQWNQELRDDDPYSDYCSG
jgi:hypothetical protein